MIADNKKTSIPFNFDGHIRQATYADLCFIIVGAQKAGTIAQMRKDFKLMEMLQDASQKESFEISKEDFENIKSLLAIHEWQSRHHDLIAFEDYILSLTAI